MEKSHNGRRKILIATGIFPPQVGGPATYSKLLLDKLPERGFEVRVLNFGDFLKQPKIMRHAAYLLRLIIDGFSSDIIYAQDPVSVGLPAVIAAKIMRKRFYLKIVGDYAWEQGTQRVGVTDLLDEFSREYGKYPLLVRALKRVQAFVANRADKIIVPSKYLKTIVTNWGVDARKVVVIYNAFDPPRVEESKEESRASLGLSGRIIVSAGRLVPWKGFLTLIRLMPAIVKEVPGSKLFIIGDGPDRNRLEAAVTETGMSDNVAMTGKLPQSDLFKYLKAADVFVLNTSYEGLSHQLLEVLALGTPVITTKAGGNTETVDHGSSGILVEYDDTDAIMSAVIEVLRNSGTADRLVKGGLEKIAGFSEEKMLSELSGELNS